jgi:hypothetical protein
MAVEGPHRELKRSLDSIYASQTQALDARQRALDEERREIEEWYSRGLLLLQRTYSEPDGGETPFAEESGRDRVTQAQERALGANGTSDNRPWGKRSMTEEVRNILDEIQDDEVFTQPIVRARFIEKHPGSDSVSLQTAISHLLRRLTNQAELERFGKRSATQPFNYRKTNRYRNRQEREEAKPLEP